MGSFCTGSSDVMAETGDQAAEESLRLTGPAGGKGYLAATK
jgi:hypothetical protein